MLNSLFIVLYTVQKPLHLKSYFFRRYMKVSAVVLLVLDLSAAFDTIDHHILLSRLHGINMVFKADNWFNSYLSDRTQRVNISGILSESKKLAFGVPQGIVMT